MPITPHESPNNLTTLSYDTVRIPPNDKSIIVKQFQPPIDYNPASTAPQPPSQLYAPRMLPNVPPSSAPLLSHGMPDLRSMPPGMPPNLPPNLPPGIGQPMGLPQGMPPFHDGMRHGLPPGIPPGLPPGMQGPFPYMPYMSSGNSIYNPMRLSNPTAKPINFRTEACKHFHSSSGCTHSANCHFIHDYDHEGKPIPNMADWRRTNPTRLKNLEEMRRAQMGHQPHFK